MRVYCVTEFKMRLNFTPIMRYLGTDRREAIRIAMSIGPPADEEQKSMYYPIIYCSLPTTIEREVIRYHRSGSTWASLVEFELKGE